MKEINAHVKSGKEGEFPLVIRMYKYVVKIQFKLFNFIHKCIKLAGALIHQLWNWTAFLFHFSVKVEFFLENSDYVGVLNPIPGSDSTVNEK